ncbi:MAG TPA: hypothetical protein VM537_26500 [Anaerolineae bacterium]|nr:hypothetical protein [Anaerolineae bacterium]
MFDFGPVAAQNDPNILLYFHTTGQVAALVLPDATPHDFVFVARPGAGKTALVKWLEGEDHARTMLSISPTRTRLLMDEDEANVEDYRIMMRAELFTAVVVEAIQRGLVAGSLARTCKAYYTKQWLKSVGKSLSDKFEGMSILGNGFSLQQSERRDYLREIRANGKVEIASKLVTQLAQQVPLTVIVDDPESLVTQGLEDMTPENAIRIGAFLSVLCQLHLLGVQVMVFAREFIVQGVQRYYKDFSHFGARIGALEWTGDDLLDVVRLRLENRLEMNWQDVFTMSEATFADLVLPCLLNGPRDLVQICNTAGKAEKRISKAMLARAIRGLATKKWQEIDSHYSAQWPAIGLFAKTACDVISGRFKSRPVARDKIRSAIEKDFQTSGRPLNKLREREDWMYTALWDTPSIEERLFIIGCLGYVHDKSEVYPWAGRSLDGFQVADSLFLTPLFS